MVVREAGIKRPATDGSFETSRGARTCFRISHAASSSSFLTALFGGGSRVNLPAVSLALNCCMRLQIIVFVLVWPSHASQPAPEWIQCWARQLQWTVTFTHNNNNASLHLHLMGLPPCTIDFSVHNECSNIFMSSLTAPKREGRHLLQECGRAHMEIWNAGTLIVSRFLLC